MKKTIYILIVLLSTFGVDAQTVINSAGGHRSASNGMTITDNVGEPFVETIGPASNIMITEGFLQPYVVYPGFNVSVLKSDLSCTDVKDGRISLAITTPYQYTATYSWTPSSVCPGNNCQTIDSLSPGSYSVSVRFTYTTTAGFIRQDSSFSAQVTINDQNGPCVVQIHSGFTPNLDNVNDTWKIENIKAFKPNKVSIFNRWGHEVYSTDNYDNETRVWSGKDKNGNELGSGTYFYIIDLGGGRKPVKGWIELIRN